MVLTGPTTSAIFHFPHAWSKLRGTGFKDTKLLHDKYGSVVRIEPNSLSYSSAQAWKGNNSLAEVGPELMNKFADIYGLKSDRTEIPKDPDFYRKEGAINIIGMGPILSVDHQIHPYSCKSSRSYSPPQDSRQCLFRQCLA